MARALAATVPPSKPSDVMRAADELAAHMDETAVIGHLLEHGLDSLGVRRVIEILRVLQHLAVE